MPASTANGFSKVAVVVARLVVDGVSLGSRHFIMPICDERVMHPGVTSYRLPARSGTTPLDFALTHFDHVHLPSTALLGPVQTSVTSRKNWWHEISRIPPGTAAITYPVIQGLKQSAFIAGKYSQHRTIVGKEGKHLPIISFATQQWPILEAVACAHVLDAWSLDIATTLSTADRSFHANHALAVVFKTVSLRQSGRCIREVAERCGAQGTFEHNMMARMEVSSLLRLNSRSQSDAILLG